MTYSMIKHWLYGFCIPTGLENRNVTFPLRKSARSSSFLAYFPWRQPKGANELVTRMQTSLSHKKISNLIYFYRHGAINNIVELKCKISNFNMCSDGKPIHLQYILSTSKRLKAGKTGPFKGTQA